MRYEIRTSWIESMIKFFRNRNFKPMQGGSVPELPPTKIDIQATRNKQQVTSEDN